MAYSHFIWGSEPRDDGGFYAWEIFNVLPCFDNGEPFPQHQAEALLRDAIECNPGYQFAMTDQPAVPAILSGQCSRLY